MRVAIPTENGALCPHFGHCQLFTIIDVDPDSKKIIETKTMTPPPHDKGVLPAWLREMGCSHIIAGGMGGRAIGLFQQSNIQVICGVAPQKPEALVKAFMNGELRAGNNLCDDPGFKAQGQGHCGSH